MGFERNLMKSYRELDLTHFTSRYILLVFVKQTKHSKWHWSNTLSVLAISWDSKEIPWNRIENSTSPNYFSIHPLKADTRSDRYQSLCQFEWWRGDSRVIVSRTRQPHFTSRYNFLSKNTCLPRNAGRLEVTLKQHFVSSRDFIGFERNPMKSYRELDLTHFTSRYILLVFVKQTKHSKWQA